MHIDLDTKLLRIENALDELLGLYHSPRSAARISHPSLNTVVLRAGTLRRALTDCRRVYDTEEEDLRRKVAEGTRRNLTRGGHEKEAAEESPDC